MIAKVIVDNRSRTVDKAFDYEIPEKFFGKIEIGSRVLVPFAKGNREVEGFCVGIKNEPAGDKLKSIIYVSDERPMFDANMLEVIQYMHNHYLCGYLDIIRTIAPPGTAIKTKEWLTVCSADFSGLSQIRRKIISCINENGGSMERSFLGEFFESDISSTLREMVKLGQLKREYRSEREISDRTVQAVRLAEGVKPDRQTMDKLLKKAPVQAKLLDIISANDYFIVSELLKFTGVSRAALNALKKKGFIDIYSHVIERNPFVGKNFEIKEMPEASEEQKAAIEEINASIDKGGGEFLLHGVTGSGKTEVFLQSIAHALQKGRSALMLVPEISLTPQMVSRFLERFGSRVAVFHSGLSKGERYDQWKRIKDGQADIVIGARSAVFAPLDNIGIIIMDEEHSETYKSEMSPRYHAKEIAIVRAKQYGAAVVFASATPSVESYYKAQAGEYKLLTMRKRFNDSKLPAIYVADMRNELAEGNRSMFSRSLYREIRRNIENKEQTILFLNRRGFSTFVSCRSCGYTAHCPNCNISLTYHKFENLLKCHYCGYTANNYTRCPDCGSPYIRYFGGGTQRVEEEIHRLFPDATTIRMDVDTTGKKQSHEKLLDKFEKEKIDILIGTQMVAKGLDFENVTLVGAVSADTMLHINDFRSAERTFAMLEQVTGRAGRGSKPGRAIIQTYSPEAEAIKLVTVHDYINFYKGEIEIRKVMWYPPFSEIIVIMFSGEDKDMVPECAGFFLKCMGNLKEQKLQILGPVAAAVSKINKKYRWQIIIKCSDDDSLNKRLNHAVDKCAKDKKYSEISIIIDKNPNMIN